MIRHATTSSSWSGCWSLSVQGNVARWLWQDLCFTAVPSCQCPCTPCCIEGISTDYCSQAIGGIANGSVERCRIFCVTHPLQAQRDFSACMGKYSAEAMLPYIYSHFFSLFLYSLGIAIYYLAFIYGNSEAL